MLQNNTQTKKIVETFDLLRFWQTKERLSRKVYGYKGLDKISRHFKGMEEILEERAKKGLTKSGKRKIISTFKQRIWEGEKSKNAVCRILNEEVYEWYSSLSDDEIKTIDKETKEFIDGLCEKIDYLFNDCLDEYNGMENAELDLVKMLEEIDPKLIPFLNNELCEEIIMVEKEHPTFVRSLKIRKDRISRQKLFDIFLKESGLMSYKEKLSTSEFKEFLVHWSTKKMKDQNCDSRNFMKILKQQFREYYKDLEMSHFLEKYGIQTKLLNVIRKVIVLYKT